MNLVISGAFLVGQSGQAEWFVHFGHTSEELPLAQRELGPDVAVPHSDGHDGQAFWVMARDPFLRHPSMVTRYLKRPVYRYQRVAYPLAAAPWRWIGGERALPWGLWVTNLVAVFIGGCFAALLARELGAPGRASLAFAVSPGVIVSVNLDTADAFALAAVLAALYLFVRGRTAWAVVAGVVAVLAKEPSLFALGGVMLFSGRLFACRRRVWLVAVPAVVAAAWAVYVAARLPGGRGSQEIVFPFVGYVDAYRRGWRHAGNWGDAVVALALLPLAAVIVWRWWRHRSVLMAAALPFALLVPCLSALVLDLTDNAVRVMAPAVTLLWLDLYVPSTNLRASRAPI